MAIGKARFGLRMAVGLCRVQTKRLRCLKKWVGRLQDPDVLAQCLALALQRLHLVMQS
jgi:hypothetical protein